MSKPPLNNPNARYWDDLVEDFGFSAEEQEAVRSGADRMIAEVRAQRLAEVRKRQHATQVEVAAAMGVSQARVSRIEKGQLERSEVDTLAAYVKGSAASSRSSLTSVTRPTCSDSATFPVRLASWPPTTR